LPTCLENDPGKGGGFSLLKNMIFTYWQKKKFENG